MENIQEMAGYILLAFGLLATLASLYRFARYKAPLPEPQENHKLDDETLIRAITRKIIVIKKLEFFSLMLLIFTLLLFYYLVQIIPSGNINNFLEVTIKIFQVYGLFALFMLPIRWLIKRKIRKLCLTNQNQCVYSMPLLMQHIKNREDISFFWRNQAIKFIQNKFF